jgi:rSAM/selenodomain-associated transferase 1
VNVTAVSPGREASVVLVVGKAPVAGRVKTRLAADVGSAAAAALARAMLLDTLDGCRREVGVVGVLCAADDDIDLVGALAGPGAPLVVQEGEGLGEALATGARRALELGTAALLVSSDIPGVPPGELRHAVMLLERGADVVLGPGADGGYWVVGLREPHPEIFDGIPWSTDAVLEVTLARCRAEGLDVRLLETWRDVDTVHDVAVLSRELEMLPGKRTARVLASPRFSHAPTTQEVPTP